MKATNLSLIIFIVSSFCFLFAQQDFSPCQDISQIRYKLNEQNNHHCDVLNNTISTDTIMLPTNKTNNNILKNDVQNNLILSIETDSSQYIYGENIGIIITATNISDEDIQILFPSGCQAYYIIEGIYNFAENAFISVITSAIIPANDSYEWSFTHNSSWNPVPIGTHKILGILENWTIFMQSETFISVVNDSNTDETQSAQPYISKIYPNPFNPTTKIEFYLPTPGKIMIDIFDSKGRLIVQERESYISSGYNTWTWNAMNNDKSTLNSGVYHARVRINDNYFFTKMVLLK